MDTEPVENLQKVKNGKRKTAIDKIRDEIASREKTLPLYDPSDKRWRHGFVDGLKQALKWLELDRFNDLANEITKAIVRKLVGTKYSDTGLPSIIQKKYDEVIDYINDLGWIGSPLDKQGLIDRIDELVDSCIKPEP